MNESSHHFLQLFWTPDVIIHDLVKFNKPEILNQVGALEIFKSGQVYYKVRLVKVMMSGLVSSDYERNNTVDKCSLVVRGLPLVS